MPQQAAASSSSAVASARRNVHAPEPKDLGAPAPARLLSCRRGSASSPPHPASLGSATFPSRGRLCLPLMRRTAAAGSQPAKHRIPPTAWAQSAPVRAPSPQNIGSRPYPGRNRLLCGHPARKTSDPAHCLGAIGSRAGSQPAKCPIAPISRGGPFAGMLSSHQTVRHVCDICLKGARCFWLSVIEVRFSFGVESPADTASRAKKTLSQWPRPFP